MELNIDGDRDLALLRAEITIEDFTAAHPQRLTDDKRPLWKILLGDAVVLDDYVLEANLAAGPEKEALASVSRQYRLASFFLEKGVIQAPPQQLPRQPNPPFTR